LSGFFQYILAPPEHLGSPDGNRTRNLHLERVTS
jgi:hypothetical protein